MGEIVECALYGDGKRIRELLLPEVAEALRRSGPNEFVWMELFEPDAPLMEQVRAALSLHELAVEDACSAHQRPKLEEYGDTHFLVLRTARWCKADRRVELGETHVFIADRFVVGVRHGETPHHGPVRKSCELRPDRLSDGPRYVLYALLDFIVDGYFPVIEALEDEVDGLEGALFEEAPAADLSRRLYSLHAEIARFRRAVAPLLEAFDRIRRVDALVSEHAQPYYRDVQDHVLRIIERLDHLRDLLSSAVETNFALVSLRQNEIMKRLAAYAALVAVPTLVAGLYGMNFSNLPLIHSSSGLWAVTAGTMLTCSFLWWHFRRMEWL
jgi:magnesium transporter